MTSTISSGLHPKSDVANELTPIGPAALNGSTHGRKISPFIDEKKQLSLAARIAFIAAVALVAMAAPCALLLLATTKAMVLITGGLILAHGAAGAAGAFFLIEEMPEEGKMGSASGNNAWKSPYTRKHLGYKNLLGFHENMFRHY